MSAPPKQPKIYHITHLSNLESITSTGYIYSDAVMIGKGTATTGIGMSTIKKRRLSLPVRCHAGDHVGDFVPFYFCPRSVMLYLLYRGNHPEITYKGGQEPIVHLEADLHSVVDWASSKDRRWAFSLSNAGAVYTEFRDDLANLDEIDWSAVANNNFASPDIKEGKQAEFLIYKSFPWKLVERVGVASQAAGQKVLAAMAKATHQPLVEIKADWYF
jgi:hypothetical protein